MNDLLNQIDDLYIQATHDSSHYYVGSTLLACRAELVRLLRIEQAARDWHNIASCKLPASVAKFQMGLDAYNALTAALEAEDE